MSMSMKYIKMAFEKPVVVIDNGSYSIKAGFSCDNHPVSIFRTVVGRPNYLKGNYGKQHYDVYIGDEAMAKIADLEFSRPVVNGRIVHWDNMERIWHHVFYRELKVAPEDRSVILGCACTTPMEEKIKCCEVFFETLNAPALCIQSQSVLSLYGSGYTTGISVDLGYDTTDINAVYEGGLLSYAHIQTNLAGAQISDYIERQLLERKMDFGIHTSSFIEGIKRDCMYVTEDASMSRRDYEYKKIYPLPSGEEVHVCQEAFLAAELIFQPDLVMGRKSGFIPLQEGVVMAAMKCDSELRPELFDAIVPCGGLAPVPGLIKRLSLEVENIISQPVNVLTSPESYAVSWLGGATFAGMVDSKNIWVHKRHYEDHGDRIVRNRFL